MKLLDLQYEVRSFLLKAKVFQREFSSPEQVLTSSPDGC